MKDQIGTVNRQKPQKGIKINTRNRKLTEMKAFAGLIRRLDTDEKTIALEDRTIGPSQTEMQREKNNFQKNKI